MTTHKRTIHLTDDNWADYLSHTYLEAQLERFPVGEDGIDVDAPIVTRLLALLTRKNARLKRRRYKMTRHHATVLLEQLAGWPDPGSWVPWPSGTDRPVTDHKPSTGLRRQTRLNRNQRRRWGC